MRAGERKANGRRRVKRRWEGDRKDQKRRMTPVEVIEEVDISHDSRRGGGEVKTICK